VPLASVTPSVWGEGGASHPGEGGLRDPGPGLSPLDLTRAAQKALALAHQEKSTFTRADLVKYLGRVLPRTGIDPAAAARLLEDLAVWKLAGVPYGVITERNPACPTIAPDRFGVVHATFRILTAGTSPSHRRSAPLRAACSAESAPTAPAGCPGRAAGAQAAARSATAASPASGP
jgi:hypothetical protein